jgi:hypothetical protein
MVSRCLGKTFNIGVPVISTAKPRCNWSTELIVSLWGFCQLLVQHAIATWSPHAVLPTKYLPSTTISDTRGTSKSWHQHLSRNLNKNSVIVILVSKLVPGLKSESRFYSNVISVERKASIFWSPLHISLLQDIFWT